MNDNVASSLHVCIDLNIFVCIDIVSDAEVSHECEDMLMHEHFHHVRQSLYRKKGPENFRDIYGPTKLRHYEHAAVEDGWKEVVTFVNAANSTMLQVRCRIEPCLKTQLPSLFTRVCRFPGALIPCVYVTHCSESPA